jgi:FtsP/CotA-like multicopper oxidase with cupredoxin domain
VNGKGLQPVPLEVKPNKTYRVRLLNPSGERYFNFAIAGHKLTVIQAGQSPVVPVVLDSIDIASGQRFDFLITTGNVVADYTINIMTNWEGSDTGPGNVFNGSYLHYTGATTRSSAVPIAESKLYDEQTSKLKPLLTQNGWYTPPPKKADRTIYLNTNLAFVDINTETALPLSEYPFGKIALAVDQDNSDATYSKAQAYVAPVTPYLLASAYGQLYDLPYVNKPIRIEAGEVVDIVVQQVAISAGTPFGLSLAHPWHMHGGTFYILGTTSMIYPALCPSLCFPSLPH